MTDPVYIPAVSNVGTCLFLILETRDLLLLTHPAKVYSREKATEKNCRRQDACPSYPLSIIDFSWIQHSLLLCDRHISAK